jgi:DNA recombination protein RmuC
MNELFIWKAVSGGLAVLLVVAGWLALRRPRDAAAALLMRLDALGGQQDRTERSLREQLASARQEQGQSLRDVREELAGAARALRDSLHAGLGETGRLQQVQLDGLAARLETAGQSQERRLEELRAAVVEQLTASRQEQVARIDSIRELVDARLQQTLEERLGASFRLVSERLELVHRGLGEMQTLAAGVGDLKRVLANVKVRGSWGEVQLGALLEQALAPDQYAVNVALREGSDDRVEFAVRLPGQGGPATDPLWLPIDAKFPLEDYQRLVEAAERGEAAAAEIAARDLEGRVRGAARRIAEKYVDPPRTTDFAVMFLPVEGLYAEVLRRPGLVDQLQRDLRVLVAGPTTLWAILNSLRLGFRTLAIQRRSSEVWSLLGAVKGDFARFGATLDAVQKKLGEASSRIDEARRGSRRIERRLQGVQEGPHADPAIVRQPATPLFDDVAAAEPR